MLTTIPVPTATPARNVPGYGMPEDPAALLDWSFVDIELIAAEHYWLTTTFPDGRPHSVPLWGLWRGNRLHFDGRPETAWARNLVRDPRCLANPPHPTRVVTLEGRARIIEDDELTEAEWADLDGRFQAKYDVAEGSPYWCLEPTTVIAWNGGKLDTMTRWRF